MQNPYKARFQITGAVHAIGEIKTFASGFQKREIVLNTNTNKPSPVPVAFLGDDIEKAVGISVGDVVSVEGFVNGREWNGRYFCDLGAKSITITKKAAGNGTTVDSTEPAAPQSAPADDDSLPF